MSHFEVTPETDITGFHIDHILPVSCFDMTSGFHQELCFHYTNLQLLDAALNIRKSNHMPPIARQLIETEGWTIEECAMYQREHPDCFRNDAAYDEEEDDV